MMKKMLAAVLAVTMAGTMLAGCGTEEKTGKSSEKKETEEGVDEIVFAYMTQNNIPEAKELQRIEDLINDYTVEKINTKVDLAIFSNADYVNQVNLMLASGEKLDVFQAYNTSHLKYIQDGTALDITEYLDNELKETCETIYDGFLKPTTVEGKTYGVLNMGSNYVPGGFTYREDIVEELDIDMSAVTKPEDLTAVFEKVKETLGIRGMFETSMVKAGVSFIIALVVILLVICFFKTHLGLCIRATGDNPDMVRASSINVDRTKIVGLMMANGLIGLSGALQSQSISYADISLQTEL